MVHRVRHFRVGKYQCINTLLIFALVLFGGSKFTSACKDFNRSSCNISMIVSKKRVLGVGVALSVVAWGMSYASNAIGSTGGSDWVNTIQPPELKNPVIIEISRNSKLSSIGDYDRVGCQGDIYRFTLSADQDALVTMSADMQAIEYPVWIVGGRNVHLRGLEMRTKVQAGCDVGEANQIGNNIPNIHPRLVGNKAFQLEQAGTTFLEGIDIDLMGQEADCFVSRNQDSMSASQIKAQRNFHIVNSRCIGIEGLNQSAIGDGIHGDFFQNQGEDDIGSLILENVTYRSSSNGITMHRWHDTTPRQFSLINVDYGWDLRYSADSRFEHQGLPFTAHADDFVFTNVWFNDGRGLNYGILNGQRLGAFSNSGGGIRKVDGVNAGVPPAGEFAPANRTGLEYGSATQQAQAPGMCIAKPL